MRYTSVDDYRADLLKRDTHCDPYLIALATICLQHTVKASPHDERPDGQVQGIFLNLYITEKALNRNLMVDVFSKAPMTTSMNIGWHEEEEWHSRSRGVPAGLQRTFPQAVMRRDKAGGRKKQSNASLYKVAE